MIEWLTGTVAGKVLSTFFISMVPIVELRAGLPYGIALGLDYPLEGVPTPTEEQIRRAEELLNVSAYHEA